MAKQAQTGPRWTAGRAPIKPGSGLIG